MGEDYYESDQTPHPGMEGVLDRCSGREVRLEGSNREPVKVGKL